MNISMQRKIIILPLFVHFSLLRQNIWNWLLKKMRFIKLTVLEVKYWKLHLSLALAFGESLRRYGLRAGVHLREGGSHWETESQRKRRGPIPDFYGYSLMSICQDLKGAIPIAFEACILKNKITYHDISWGQIFKVSTSLTLPYLETSFQNSTLWGTNRMYFRTWTK